MGTRPRNTLHFNFFKLQVLKHLIFYFWIHNRFLHMANTKSSLLEPMDIDTLDLLEVACQTTSFAFFFGDTCLGRLGPKNLRVIFSDTTGLGKFQTTNAQTFFHWQFALPPEAPSLASSLVSKTQNEHITKSRLKLWMDAGTLLEYCI